MSAASALLPTAAPCLRSRLWRAWGGGDGEGCFFDQQRAEM